MHDGGSPILGEKGEIVTKDQVAELIRRKVIQEWFQALRQPVSPRTIDSYSHAMIRYLRYHGKTPEELLEIREKEDIRISARMLNAYVADPTMADTQRRTDSQAIKSFFACHYLDLPRKCGQIYVPRKKRKPTIEQIVKMTQGEM